MVYYAIYRRGQSEPTEVFRYDRELSQPKIDALAEHLAETGDYFDFRIDLMTEAQVELFLKDNPQPDVASIDSLP